MSAESYYWQKSQVDCRGEIGQEVWSCVEEKEVWEEASRKVLKNLSYLGVKRSLSTVYHSCIRNVSDIGWR